MPYKQPKNTPLHSRKHGASIEPVSMVLGAIKLGKVIAGAVKGAKAAKLAATGVKAAKAAKTGKVAAKAAKAAKAIKASKVGKAVGKAKKGVQAANTKLKASKVGQNVKKGVEKGKEIKGKVDKGINKGFDKVEELTGGKLGNAEELKGKVGGSAEGKANEIANSAIDSANETYDSGQFLKEPSQPKGEKDTGGNSYSNPKGPSMKKQVGTSTSGNIPQTVTNPQPLNSLSPSNIDKSVAAKASVPRVIRNLDAPVNIKGFNINVGDMARLGHALASTRMDAVKKERRVKKLQEQQQNLPTSKLSAQVDASNKKMSALAKNMKPKQLNIKTAKTSPISKTSQVKKIVIKK